MNRISRNIENLLDLIGAPDDIAERLAGIDRLTAEVAERGALQASSPSQAALQMDGATAVEAREEIARLDAEIAARNLDQKSTYQAIEGLHRVVARKVAEQTTEIVEGPLRVVVSDLLDDVSGAAAKLSKFAPDFDREDIDRGTAAEQKAWLSALDLNEDLTTLIKGWLSLMQGASRRGGPATGSRLDAYLLPRRPGGVAAWLWPEDGSPPPSVPVSVLDGVRVHCLAIAPYRDAYRLASPPELVALARLYGGQLEHPHRAGRRRPEAGILQPKQAAAPPSRQKAPSVV